MADFAACAWLKKLDAKRSPSPATGHVFSPTKPHKWVGFAKFEIFFDKTIDLNAEERDTADMLRE